ncbi:MFS transporter [uncultured Succinatimonas sp.]|uniref:MFS transporter n=1 Tax=uncultured Succinatimonas sp. TaxID=1262973 RepID=UPI0025EFA072|nr:MFS transporter [uncultured Succinatimonas sp.]
MKATDTAISLPSASWSNVSIMSLSHFTSDFFCNVLPIMLPILAARYGISYSQSAALFMVFSVSTNFLQPPIGIWADKRPVNYLMPLSILTGAFFASIVGWSPNIYVLIFIILLSGICSSAFHPISAGIVHDISPKRHQTFATSIYIAGGNLGFAIAPLIIAAFIEQFTDKNLPFLFLFALIVTLMIYKQRLFVTPPRNESSSEPQINLKSIIKSKQFIFLNTSIALRSWCYCALVVFLPLLLTAHGYSTVESGLALMCLLVGTVFGGLATGGLSDKYGLRTLIVSTYVLTIASLGFFLWRLDISFISMVALFLAGAGMYGSTPAAIVWAQRLLPRNAAFAASMMLGFTFGMGYVESVITGFVGDLFGLRVGLIATIFPALVLAIIIILALKEPPKATDVNLKNI